MKKELLRIGLLLGRALVMASLVGLLLWLVQRYDSLWLSVGVLLAVTLWAVLFSVRRRTHVWAVFAGTVVSSFLFSLPLVLAVRYLSAVSSAVALVPVGGLLLAATLTSTRVGLQAYGSERRAHVDMYEYLVGNGASHLAALQPFVLSALHRGLSPLLRRMAILGFGGLPVILCALLIGGLSPLGGTLFFGLLLVAAVAASVVSLLIALWIYERRQDPSIN